ncbi:MAG: CPBP family glutamic-type intramembrane protease [Acidobacteriota bacterium]
MSKAEPTKTGAKGKAFSSGLSEGLPRRLAGPLPFRSSEPPSDAPIEAPDDSLPDRYELRDREDGLVLYCREAPGISVRIDRSFSFTEQEARKLPEHTILLDGAGAFGPLVDDARHLYNLDHHEGCQRAFTLATCEQALILVLKGLELDLGDWTLYANEPDLDTVFAIWVLLNHRRVRALDDDARDRIIPLLRLEGSIDANGFEIAEFSGLPQDWVRSQKERLDALHQRELDVKRSGVWTEGDPVEYTRGVLAEIDRMVYLPTDFDDFASVELEYGHVDIGQAKVAVVCRDPGGIYDVEKRLRKVWGDRLGLIVLEKEAGHFTLRRAASLSGIALADAYSKLNLLDPVVDGRPPAKRWGGSDDIGGSPRPMGSGLTPREIGKILKLTYRRIKPVQRLQKVATAGLWTVVLSLVAGVSLVSWRFFGSPSADPQGAAIEIGLVALICILGAVALTRQHSRGWTWLYGWRSPSGRDWLLLVPVVLGGSIAGGAWLPTAVSSEGGDLAKLMVALAALALGLELVFRGLVHGMLLLDWPIQGSGERWFLSWPNAFAAGLYAAVTTAVAHVWLPAPPLPLGPWLLGISMFIAAFVTGLALGAVRERSLSLWPGVGLLFLGSLARLAFELSGVG